jgi:peroxiredoxin
VTRGVRADRVHALQVCRCSLLDGRASKILGVTPRCLVAATALASVLLPAQDTRPDDTFGHSRHGAAFDDGPRQAAYLMGGTGDVHFPISARHPDAQRFFDQGIGQLHGFWYFEAERSFRQVAALEPGCAIAYWGMAMANKDNDARAAGFAAQAMLRREQASERERSWIDAVGRYYEVSDADLVGLRSPDLKARKAAGEELARRAGKRDEKKLGRQLVRDLEAIVAAEPEDVEAKAFLVNQVWLNWRDAGVDYNNFAGPDALLEEIFRRAPMHPSHHYRIHLWDQENAVRALRSAALVGPSAPTIAHQWHMAGHIYERLHRPADVAWQMSAAACADHAQMQRDRVPPYEIHNYAHNQEWLIRALIACGRAHDALAASKNLIELPRHPKKNALGKPRSAAGYGRERLLDVLVEFEMWEELLACAAQGYLDQPAALALACLMLGRNEEAGRHLAAIEAPESRPEATESRPQGDDARAESRPLRDAGQYRAWVRALRDAIRGDKDAALAGLERARSLTLAQRAAVNERVGRLEEARKLYQQDVEKQTNEVPPLARYVRALHSAGQTDECGRQFEKLRTVAGGADLQAPLLARLAPVARALGLPRDWRKPPAPRDDVGGRPALEAIGPLHWSPTAAPAFALPAAGGGSVTLAQYRGRPLLVVCYLGFGCLRCVEQLKALQPRQQDLRALGVEVVAIGTDPLARARAALQALGEGERLDFPILADPGLQAFRAWRAYDDFEAMPLHGMFLVDAAGQVRWQDVGPEPFTDLQFLLGEARRLLGLGHGSGGGK